MKTILSILVSIIFGVSTVYGQKLVTKEFAVKNYDKIEVRNSLDVKLVADGRESVSVRCDERLLPAIEIKTQGEILKIGFNWAKIKEITGRKRNRSISISKDRIKINGIVFNGGIEIIAHIKRIHKLETMASAGIYWEGNLPTNKLEINCSSSGDVKWTGLLDIDKVEIDCSSSGDVKGDIKAKEVEIELSSSADYEGNIETTKIEAEVSSSADIEGTLIAETAEFEISSSADIVLHLNAVKAIFDMSSSADANIEGIIDELFVEASSSAEFQGKHITYKQAEVKATSSADIYLSKSGKVIDNTPKRSGVFIE